jgi:nucleotide-binding universal stress UspA family protein
MYRSILAPVDGTAFGEHALPFAATLARRAGATLHLIHVHQPVSSPASMETLAYRGAWNEIVREQEAGYLEGLAERLSRGHSIPVEVHMVEGEVAAGIGAAARECGAGVVVMATHGRSGVARLLHHRISEQIAREIGIPVLVVRPERADDEPVLSEERQLRRVLIPLGGTDGGGSVLDTAIEIGRLFRARFTLLSVVQPEFAAGGKLTRNPAELHHQLMRAQTAARQYLNALAERMRAEGLEVEAVVRFAPDVTAGVVTLVASRPAHEGFDMILMEGRPRHPLSHLLSGAPHEQVAKRANVPVMLVQ